MARTSGCQVDSKTSLQLTLPKSYTSWSCSELNLIKNKIPVLRLDIVKRQDVWLCDAVRFWSVMRRWWPDCMISHFQRGSHIFQSVTLWWKTTFTLVTQSRIINSAILPHLQVDLFDAFGGFSGLVFWAIWRKVYILYILNPVKFKDWPQVFFLIWPGTLILPLVKSKSQLIVITNIFNYSAETSEILITFYLK